MKSIALNVTFNFGNTDTTGVTGNYFNAVNTAALTSAIEGIFQTIVQALGVSQAALSDGTTSAVETSTGEIANLLGVDETSYRYWISIPLTSNRFQRVALTGESAGETITYTVTDNGDGTCTVTWGTNSVTVDGSVSLNVFKYEWKEKNALYNYDPPAAQFNSTSGAVDWDLSPVGTLLNGVTYAVTFNVYPSQTTLDIIADIKNDPGEDGAWGELDSKIQDYITVDGKLQTNTTVHNILELLLLFFYLD